MSPESHRYAGTHRLLNEGTTPGSFAPRDLLTRPPQP